MSAEEYPLVSVVMPVRNEADFIESSLGCVLAQDYPADRLEVIIADGMSTDGTREIVQALQAQREGIRLVDNPGRIAPTGLNAAISEAKGEIIVRVDGHCDISPDYVRRCVEHLRHDGVDVVGGPIETVGGTALARVIAVAMGSGFGVGGSAFRTVTDRTMLTDTVAFPAYTRAALDRAGPFDEELVRNQDDEFSYRLRELGFSILLAADVTSRYYSRSSLRKLWRQYLQYGYWKVRVMQKHPRQMRLRHFVPPVFVASLLASGTLAVASPLGRLAFLSVLGAYVAANLFASVLVAAKSSLANLPVLPIVFAILHLSYGAGFLAGLIRFCRRWGGT